MKCPLTVLERRATVSYVIRVKQRQTVLIPISLCGDVILVQDWSQKNGGNQGLAISQGVDDVDVDVEYEPAEQLLSLWIRIVLAKSYFRFDGR